jgi:FSR family fosmidomycin resistance protein-like MFS transporter
VILISTPAHVVTDGFGVGLAVLLALRFGQESAYGEVGVVLAAFALATALSEPLWGRFSDKTGRRPEVVGWGLILGASTFSCLGFLDPAGTVEWALLLAAAILCGVGAGSYHGVASALVNEVTEPHNRGLLLGINNAGGSLGRTLAPLAIALVASWTGSLGASTLPFLAAGVLIGVAFLVGLRDRPRHPPAPRGPRVPTWEVLTSPMVVRLSGLCFLRTAFFLTSVNLLPIFLLSERGMDPVPMGALVSAVMATGVLAQPLGGALSDRMDRRKLIGSLLASSGLCFGLFLLLEGAVLSVVLLALYLFLVLMSLPLVFALLGDAVPHDRLGVATGVVSGVGQFSAAVAQIGAGILAQRFGATPVLLGVAGLGVLAGAVAFTLPAPQGISSQGVDAFPCPGS